MEYALTWKATVRVFRSINAVGLRARLILIGIAVLVPLVAVMFQLAQYEREIALASAKQRVHLFASLTAELQYRLVQRAEIVLGQLASEWQALEGRECGEFLAAAVARHEWMAAIRVSTPDGNGLCGDKPGILDFNVSDRSYFKAVMAGEMFVLSNRLISWERGQSIVVASVPVLNGERLIGVLSAAIELEALANLLPVELRNDPGVVVNLIDRNGILLARHPHVPEFIDGQDSERPVLTRALQVPSGTAELPDLNGDTRFFAFEKIDTVGWVVAVGISRDSVIGPIATALRKRLLLIAAIVMASGLVGLIGGEMLFFGPCERWRVPPRRSNAATWPRAHP